jgi:vacuolar protein sorting-associated protein 52
MVLVYLQTLSLKFDTVQKEPVEALLRSLLLVVMDNATAEYTFITTFFQVDPGPAAIEHIHPFGSPTALLSPGSYLEPNRQSQTGSDFDIQPSHDDSIRRVSTVAVKEEQANMDAIWKQIMDPVLEYCQVIVSLEL